MPETVQLAKSPRNRGAPAWSETLEGHLLQVGKTAETLVELRGALALHSLGLDGSLEGELRRAVLSAAYLHDIGKLSHQFQRLVRRRDRATPQALRHEWISAAVLLEAPLAGWLFEDAPLRVRDATVAAVLGHHLKAEDPSTVFEPRSGSGDRFVDLALEAPDVSNVLQVTAQRLGVAAPPVLVRQRLALCSWPPDALRSWARELQHRWRRDPELACFVALVKAFVVASDGAGSGLPKSGIDPAEWAREALSTTLEVAELEAVVRQRLGKHRPREFQVRASRTRSRICFVRAGCGSGKTVAAYMWSARRAPGRRLFVCYPTTGTATEGFRDYVWDVESGPESALLHSRSRLDLEDLLGAEDDSLDLARRLGSLLSWSTKVNVCTVDRVLGIIQNYRSSLDTSPVFFDAAFVFDEIHQYDERLWAALLRFIETFKNAPILLMTASLPQARLARLRELAAELGDDLDEVWGPRELETVRRYSLRPVVEQIPWDEIRSVTASGGKILVVANTVNRCREIASQAVERGFGAVLVYHSRYRYRDRVERHRGVVESFRQAGAAMAVTTQVCEVSLDLSADLLVTELAPFPALIQRLGRLNRRDPENRGPLPAIVVEVPDPKPYRLDEIERARSLLQPLVEKDLSQHDLAVVLEEADIAAPSIDLRSQWLDDGAFSAQVAPLREQGYTVPVLLSADRPACQRPGRGVDIDAVNAHAIPMPFGPVKDEVRGWSRLSFAFVAPEGRLSYSPDLGGSWN
jgi:CRISPR-associated endonuclease/helicase Cas3